ncbi:MAG: DNA recombination protein RmuC [Actinomycetota bacterium]
MREIGFALLGIALGAAVAAVAIGLRRVRPAGDRRVEARLEVQAAELRRIADATATRDAAAERVQAELAAARRALEDLALRERERREGEIESADVVRRLSAVLSGGGRSGRAGENVLREQLAQLPPSMLVSDLRVNGKVVEFALLLPDGRRLPIDSKWPAAAELQALEAATDPVERDAPAREVAQYLDTSLTAPVGVAAVPDAAYAVLRRAHADAFARGVVVVPYSTALPVLLFLSAIVGRYGDAGDARACLAEVASLLDAMEGVIENKVARAATMLANGADEFRSHLGKARGSLSRARSADAPPAVADPPPAVADPEAALRVVP